MNEQSIELKVVAGDDGVLHVVDQYGRKLRGVKTIIVCAGSGRSQMLDICVNQFVDGRPMINRRVK